MEGRTVSGRRWRGGRRCGGTTTENSIAATKWRMFWESRAGTRTNGVLLGCPSANDGARVPRSHERELAEIGFDIALDWRELRRLLRLLHHRGANGNRHTSTPCFNSWLTAKAPRAPGPPPSRDPARRSRPRTSSNRAEPRRRCRARLHTEAGRPRFVCGGGRRRPGSFYPKERLCPAVQSTQTVPDDGRTSRQISPAPDDGGRRRRRAPG